MHILAKARGKRFKLYGISNGDYLIDFFFTSRVCLFLVNAKLTFLKDIFQETISHQNWWSIVYHSAGVYLGRTMLRQEWKLAKAQLATPFFPLFTGIQTFACSFCLPEEITSHQNLVVYCL